MSTPDALAAVRAAMAANAALYGTPCFTQADFERARKLLAEKFAKEEEQALADAPDEPLSNEELNEMLDALNRQYHADTQAEIGTRSYPAKPSFHDE